MTMGHFATALIPYSKVKGSPAWLLLLCAQFADFFWLVIALFGFETPSPPNFLDVTIVSLKAVMPYSHTGLDTLVLALVVAGAVQAGFKNATLSVWCGALVVGHWLCDLLSGWRHEVFTVGTPMIGLGLYDDSPYIAFAIEIVFSGLICLWFLRSEAGQGRALTGKQKAILFGAFVGGSTFFVATARHSFRMMLGL